MSINLEILFQDDNRIAVNKPAGLATVPRRGETDSLIERLADQTKLLHTGTEDPRLRAVHRLHKDTSGVVLFARNRATQRHLSHQFQNNQVEKEYLAIVVGRPAESEGEIEARIGRHPTQRDRMTVLKRGGRPARTAWKVEELFRHCALLRVFPRTGKTHQIRVHLRHIGAPLAVDPLYNPPAEAGSPAGSLAPVGLFLSSFKRGYRTKRGEEERPLIDRLTLHAHRLTFRALDDRRLTVEAPLPKDFRVTLNMLRKYG